MHAVLEQSTFGIQLRRWRKQRGLSQLDLALAAEVSPRNLSFVETGRSRPKRDLILKLADALEIPLRERNSLFLAAGLPAAYEERDFQHEDLDVYRQAISDLITKHEPWPAFVVNRWGDLIDFNAPARKLLPPDAQPPLNLYESYLFSAYWPGLVENWSEVAWSAYWHLREDAARYWGDERMQALLHRVFQLVQDLPQPSSGSGSPTTRTRLRMGSQIVETTTMVARFGTSQDVLLSELSVEMIFPANEAARVFFAQLEQM